MNGENEGEGGERVHVAVREWKTMVEEAVGRAT